MDWEMGIKLTAMGVSRISSRKMLMSLTNMSSMTQRSNVLFEPAPNGKMGATITQLGAQMQR